MHLRSTVSNLGGKVDSDFTLDRQIRAVMKSSFYQLRKISKVKDMLLKQDFDTAIQYFITSCPA